MSDWNVGDEIHDPEVYAGRWRVYKVLRGGMGVVYIVYDHERYEPYALKTFQDEVFDRDPGIAGRFRREMLAWINLDAHENVAEAVRVLSLRGKPYLFLEYVNGGDLSQWVGTPRLTGDLPQVLRLGVQFCDGMSHALSKGIRAHRDVKPQNCLLTRHGLLKVTDFGLAKVLEGDDGPPPPADAARADETASGLTRTGVVAGTPLYMAPEQFDDPRRVDARADIYSFGVMLYQMVTGEPPFKGRTPKELERQHKSSPPPSLKSFDAELGRVVERCLAKQAGERFDSFGDVRERLLEIHKRLSSEGELQAPRQAEPGATSWFNKGTSFYQLGMAEEAVACYDRALQLDPTAIGAWANRGAALASLGRWEEALASHERALELDPLSAATWVNRGQTLKELGRGDESLACYERALELDPAWPSAWYSKGVFLREAGQEAAALACFERVLELDPQHASALDNMAWLLSRQGRLPEALDCYERIIGFDPRLAGGWSGRGSVLSSMGQVDEALACYDRALELDPGHVTAWGNRGSLLLGRKRFWEAVECFDRVLASDPGDAAAWQEKGAALFGLGRDADAAACFEEAHRLGAPGAADALALCRRTRLEAVLEDSPDADEEFKRSVSDGLEFEGRGLWEQALTCYERALSIDPNHAKVWFKKGAVLNELGRHDEELSCCERALALDPRLVRAWVNMGVELRGRGRVAEALACYERALEIDPGDAGAWVNKGAALSMLGATDEAVACFDRALEADPHFAAAWINKGGVAADAGRRAEAVECCDRALRFDPWQWQAWLLKARMLMAGPETAEEALVCFARVLDINPLSVEAWINRGALLALLGRDGAAACYERALELDPRNETAWHNMGGELSNAGRPADAVECYERALEVNPDYANAWLNRGRALAEGLGLYREAAASFEQAGRLGHPLAAEWLAWCRQQLGS
ncbi:MAG TPA: tetratricopeptide repeat protein [Pyrinomonadaceae bacterium]|jgi:tetratricopeptide (TPR) repeat protein